ncbi:SAM-dependent methyltransferase [Bounagaea algeriensis]
MIHAAVRSRPREVMMVASHEPAAPSAEIDTSVPHEARVYNYWLSGKDNYAVDRELGGPTSNRRPNKPPTTGPAWPASLSSYPRARLPRNRHGR